MPHTLWHANLKADRYDYTNTYPKRRPYFVRAVRANRPGLLSLAECQGPAAASLARTLDLRYKSYRGSSILWDNELYRFKRTVLTRSWLSGQTHSLLGLEFQDRETGEFFNLLSTHFPPFAYRAGLRKRQMQEITDVTAKWNDPIILATDANWSKTFESYVKEHGDWTSFRVSAPNRLHSNYRTSGTRFSTGNPIDYVISRKKVFPLRYEVVDGRKWSDHNALEVEFTLNAVSPL